MPFNTVLLVDGDRRSARVLAHLLGDDGFEVEVVFDGAAALARLERDPVPALILTELHLPGASGATLAQRTLADFTGVEVVMLTHYPHLVPDELARRLVVHTKPVDYGRLCAELRSGLSRSRRQSAQSVRIAAAGRAC